MAFPPNPRKPPETFLGIYKDDFKAANLLGLISPNFVRQTKIRWRTAFGKKKATAAHSVVRDAATQFHQI